MKTVLLGAFSTHLSDYNASADVFCRIIARESQQVSLVHGKYSKLSAKVQRYLAEKAPACS
jgi:hypothetical protein